MKLCVISFTEKGIQLSKNLAEKIAAVPTEGRVIEEVQLFTKCRQIYNLTNNHTDKQADHQKSSQTASVLYIQQSVMDWAGGEMAQHHALLFIGACGIGVRAIAPHITDKLHDSPVLVMDEQENYVIPILAGHVGGANELARRLAVVTGAQAVITTATDLSGGFAVDLFAKANQLSIVNKEGIARVSAKVLAGQEICIAVEGGHIKEGTLLPSGVGVIAESSAAVTGKKVDVMITSKVCNSKQIGELPDSSCSNALFMTPREFIIGIGCRKGKDEVSLRDYIQRTLDQLGISIGQVAAIASIDRKAQEAGLLAWSRKERIPFLTYTAEELGNVEGAFKSSEFVAQTVGVDNVCERAALRGCGGDGCLVYGKHAEDGMTIAIAQRKWSVEFEEE